MTILVVLNLIYSCKKGEIEKELVFGDTRNSVVIVKDTVINKSVKILDLYLEIVLLDTNLISKNLLQGNKAISDINITYPVTSTYTFSYANLTKLQPDLAPPQSTLLLFDKSSGYWVRFDDCLNYWVESISDDHEYAIGAMTDGISTDGYKIYGDGFISKNSENKTQAVFDMIQDDPIGNYNVLEACLAAIPYLDQNASNSEKSIVIFTTTEAPEHPDLVDSIVDLANQKNIRISFFAPEEFDYDYVEIAKRTDGFHCYQRLNTNDEIRLNAYSIQKLIERKYYSFGLDFQIVLGSGSFFTWSSFGYFIYVNDQYVFYWDNI